MKYENFSFENRQDEISRINNLTKLYWDFANEHPEQSKDFFLEMNQNIFDTRYIQTHIEGLEHLDPEKSYIFAPNHPGVLDEHKILFHNQYSLPYYILHFIDLIEQKTGKKVHFIVTEPHFSEAFKKIIENLECIMVPPTKERKMTDTEINDFNAQIQEYLEKGEHVALFPEGHYYGSGNIGPLKKGLFHVARENVDHPVVPVRMDGFDEPYEQISITLGTPEKFSQTKGKEDLNTLVEEFRQRVFVDGLGMNPVETR